MYELLPIKKVNLPPHPFATDWQAVLFRNFGTVSVSALAKVLKTDEKTVEAESKRLGLEGITYQPDWKEKGYITIIKNNWHLLDYAGICTLLETTEEQLAKTLFDDDFLFVKVGNFKPEVENPVFKPLTEEQIRITEEQAKTIRENRSKNRTPYFEFLKHAPKVSVAQTGDTDAIRMVYYYNELFGDNLLTGDFSAYTDEMLEGLSKLGINAIWKHIVLYELVGLPFDETYGKGWEIRLKNLRVLCKKLEKYGIKLWLYLNEPRALPLAFFKDKPHLFGVHDDSVGTLCTSAPETQKYLYDAIQKIVTQVPELGGFFSITASENLTNCYSRREYDVNACPRCKNRTRVDVCTEINEIYQRALDDANSNAKLIVWTWGWNWEMGWSAEETLEAVRKTTEKAAIMCVSEEGLIVKGDEGSAGLIDYSISQIGPSDRTKQIFEAAKESGHKTVAKMQVNNSWECASIPYLPCFESVWKHLQKLRALDVDGHMLSWSLGGYPSFNLSLVSQAKQGGTIEEWYQNTFGEDWQKVQAAAKYFSDGFEKFPYGVSLAYCGPQNIGCANPFYEEKTGFNATMVGFPYDDIDTWRGNFSRKLFIERFAELTGLWKKGLEELKDLKTENSVNMQRIAKAAYCVLRSTYLQSKWIMERDISAAEEEFSNTQTLITLAAEDPSIGFEACNHYLYHENTLLEKLLSLKKILQKRA